MERSLGGKTSVESFTLCGFGSPPPDTVALFVTDDGALAATFTVTVIDG
jgi:hypothetical protein